MIKCRFIDCGRRCWIIAGLVLVWFLVFPEDMESLVAPFRTLLSLTTAISPWLYVLASVALACWTVHVTWGKGRIISNEENE